MKKNNKIIEQTEVRGYEVKLAYTEKKLVEAIAKGSSSEIEMCEKNIKYYKDILDRMEKQ